MILVRQCRLKPLYRQAGLHADEMPGVLVLQHLMTLLDAAEARGGRARCRWCRRPIRSGWRNGAISGRRAGMRRTVGEWAYHGRADGGAGDAECAVGGVGVEDVAFDDIGKINRISGKG